MASSVAWMRQLAQGGWRDKAGRALDRVPRPAIWEPGQCTELIKEIKRLERLSGASRRRVRTEVFSLALFHYYQLTLVRRAVGVLGRGSRPTLQGTRRDTGGG